MEDERPHEDLDMEQLIEASSLGTPEVAALRATTPRSAREQMLAGVLHPDPKIVVIVVPKRSRWRTQPSEFLRCLQDFCRRIV